MRSGTQAKHKDQLCRICFSGLFKLNRDAIGSADSTAIGPKEERLKMFGIDHSFIQDFAYI